MGHPLKIGALFLALVGLLAVSVFFSRTVDAMGPGDAPASLVDPTDERSEESATISGPKVAVLDVQAIWQQADAVRSINEQLNTLRKAYADEIAAQQKVLEEAEQVLKTQRDKLSQEELTAKSRSFEARVASLQSRVQQRKQALEEAHQKAMDTFEREMISQVSAYSKEFAVDIVLKRSQVVLASHSLNITDVILEHLNDALPRISVDVPSID